MAKERLQKVLAAAGVASRRECEHVILDGRVEVNGKRVDRLPVLVDPQTDEIRLDGRPLAIERKVYFLLHKPKGVHCTNRDPDGRPRAIDLMAGVSQRVFPVGRLDADSTGLLLMTNDGELAERVSHPRYGVPKTYRAHVSGRVTPEELAQLRRGIWLSDGKAQVAHAKLIHGDRKRSVLEVTLREGHNREVRRVLAKIGHPVRKLIRIQIGPLSLDGLGSRQFRPLRRTELRALRDACDPQRRPTKRAPASGARRPPKPSSPRSRKRARSRDRQGHRR